MMLQATLHHKGTEVRTIEPDATLDDVIEQLVRYNIGSLVVCEPAPAGSEPRVLGIITERDILRVRATRHAPLEEVRVAAVMSTELVTASPENHIEHAMELMTRRRVRHLPVLSQGRLVGIVSRAASGRLGVCWAIGRNITDQHDDLGQVAADYIDKAGCPGRRHHQNSRPLGSISSRSTCRDGRLEPWPLGHDG